MLAGDIAGGTTQCAQIETAGGTVNIIFRDSICHGERGLRLRHDPSAATVLKTSYVIERNRFEPGGPSQNWTYDGLDLLFSFIGHPLPAGSKLRAEVRNNEFLRTRYEGIYITAGIRSRAPTRPIPRSSSSATPCLRRWQNAIWDNSRSSGCR